MRDRDRLALLATPDAPLVTRSWGITLALVRMPHTLPRGGAFVSLTPTHTPGKRSIRLRIGHTALVVSFLYLTVPC